MRWLSLARLAFGHWRLIGARRMGAALAFYALFSTAPLLIIATYVAGLVFGDDAARGEVSAGLALTLGASEADVVEQLVRSASESDPGLFATAVGLAAILYGSTRFFTYLQLSLDDVQDGSIPVGRGTAHRVRTRLLSFALVLVVGLLLVVSLGVSVGLSAVGIDVDAALQAPRLWARLGVDAGGFVVLTLLFAALYTGLPTDRPDFKSTLGGAAVAAAMFTVGRYLLGTYLAHRIGSTYGAAGSVLLMLLWVYYSAQIFLFGACWVRVQRGEPGAGDEGAR
jgi:membrane protein